VAKAGWRRGAYRGSFCEKLVEASPMSSSANASCFKADPLLAKAKTISDGGSTLVIMYLWRGKTMLHNSSWRGLRLCERNNSADTQVGAEGGGKVLQALEQRFPAARGADHGEAGCRCSHGGPRGSRSPTCSPGRTPRWSRECPKEAVILWGACAGAGLLEGLVTPLGTQAGAVCS